jgi:hypothetical protein
MLMSCVRSSIASRMRSSGTVMPSTDATETISAPCRVRPW